MPWVDSLLCCIQYKDHDEARRLMEAGCEPDGTALSPVSPLRLSMQCNDIAIFDLLVQYKADINFRDENGQTAIFDCVDEDIGIKFLEKLLSLGAKTDIQDKYFSTPLHFAAFFGIPARVSLIMDLSSDIVNCKNYFGYTALHHCIRNVGLQTEDVLSVSKILLDAGADINAQDEWGRSSLHLAADHYSHEKIVRFLLTYATKIDFSLKTKDGDTFLHCLLSNQYLTQSFLLEVLECDKVSEKDLKLMLNERNHEGITPLCLHLESAFANTAVVQKMIQFGADVNVSDFLGVSPLVRACDCSHDVSKLLLESGANANAIDMYGKNALYCAIDTKTVALLLEHGINLSANDCWGRSPLCQRLHFFNMSDEENSNAFLIEKGSDVNHRDIFGGSLLHYAAYDADEEVVSLLLSNGGDVTERDNQGLSAVDIAKIRRRRDVIDTFQDFTGCDYGILNELLNFTHLEEIEYSDVKQMDNLQRMLNIPKEVKHIAKNVLTWNMADDSVMEENENICGSLVKLLGYIAERMNIVDDRFRVEMFQSGSSCEGTKTGDPNEFDFVFCLTQFGEICDIVETHNTDASGLVHLASKITPPPKEFAYFFDDSGMLLSTNIKEVFARYLKIILREPTTWLSTGFEYGGPTINFEPNFSDHPVFSFIINQIGPIHKNLHISVDVVPAIRATGWWPSGLNFDKLSLVSSHLRAAGCLLLVQVPRIEGSHFRISCSLTESNIMKTLPKLVKDGYMLAKLMATDEYCPAINFAEDDHNDDYYECSHCVNEVIKSYMLKNCLFHILESGPLLKQITNGYTSSVIDVTVELFKRLRTGARANCLQNYVLQSQNIFSYRDLHLHGVSEEEVLPFTSEVCKEIDAYCTVILGCLGVYGD